MLYHYYKRSGHEKKKQNRNLEDTLNSPWNIGSNCIFSMTKQEIYIKFLYGNKQNILFWDTSPRDTTRDMTHYIHKGGKKKVVIFPCLFFVFPLENTCLNLLFPEKTLIIWFWCTAPPLADSGACSSKCLSWSSRRRSHVSSPRQHLGGKRCRFKST